ncbi:MAG: DapH/DapD/GlmU-related protein [Rhodococcus sp. (in: high G+C Gram-positive bacteria)]
MTDKTEAGSTPRSGDGAKRYVLGAGGHARAVAAAHGRPIDGRIGPGCTLDDDAALGLDPGVTRLLNGIGFVGMGRVRRLVHERFRTAGFQLEGVRHPQAIVDPDAAIAHDAQVMIGAVIVTGAVIGEGAIINSAAVVEHGVVVGAHSHIGPGVVLCGDVVIGEDVFIGAGAVVLPGVEIGAGAVVGAGSVVREHLGDGIRAVGSPARILGAKQ